MVRDGTAPALFPSVPEHGRGVVSQPGELDIALADFPAQGRFAATLADQADGLRAVRQRLNRSINLDLPQTRPIRIGQLYLNGPASVRGRSIPPGVAFCRLTKSYKWRRKLVLRQRQRRIESNSGF